MTQDTPQTTTEETGARVYIPILPEGTPIVPPVSRAEARRSENYLRATLDLADRNNDGFLSQDEAAGMKNIPAAAAPLLIAGMQRLAAYNASVGNLPTLMRSTAVIDNPVLFDAGSIAQRYGNNPIYPGLNPVSIARIVQDVLPHGIATIRLSDTCPSELTCTPLPHNKMVIGPRAPTI